MIVYLNSALFYMLMKQIVLNSYKIYYYYFYLKMNQPQEPAFETIIQGISMIEENEDANLQRKLSNIQIENSQIRQELSIKQQQLRFNQQKITVYQQKISELSRLQTENNELRDDLQMKKKLLDIQKSTNQTLDSQQKMLRERVAAHEQRIRYLQAQLRDKSSIVRNLQASQTPQTPQSLQTQTSSNNDQVITDLQKRANDLQRQLEDENRNHELRLNDEKRKVEQYELKLQSVSQELKHLRAQNYQLKHNSTLDNSCSRQLDELKLQIEQGNSNLKKAQMEKQTLRRENEQLLSRIASATTSKNEVTIKQVIRQAGNPQELKELKNINQKLGKQLDATKREKAAFQKLLNSLKQELDETKRRQDSIRVRYRQLDDQVARLKTGAKPQSLSSDIMEELPEHSKIRTYDLDAQQLNEGRSVRVVPVHKKMVESLLNHFNNISVQEKIPFLNILTCWSEEQQQKLQISISELEQPDYDQ